MLLLYLEALTRGSNGPETLSFAYVTSVYLLAIKTEDIPMFLDQINLTNSVPSTSGSV